jgi:hypothetical protein
MSAIESNVPVAATACSASAASVGIMKKLIRLAPALRPLPLPHPATDRLGVKGKIGDYLAEHAVAPIDDFLRACLIVEFMTAVAPKSAILKGLHSA